MEVSTNSHDVNHDEEQESLWYTYFGETGAATVAFMYICLLAIVIYSFLRWG